MTIDILAECYRRASRARDHQHMVDLMAIAGLLSRGLTEAQIEQAKLKAED
jgi:sensor histidine kinase regulating citrate/malate metabolism